MTENRIRRIAFLPMLLQRQYNLGSNRYTFQESIEASLVFEEIGAADAGFASALCISASIAQAIIHFGTKEQKGRWLPKICKDTDFILGFGVTEYGVGSEAYIASEDPKVGSKTTCKLEGDHYVINGVKHFISNGG